MIANMEKATAAKVEKMKKELAQQEQDINSVVYMINEALNEWKQTRLQAAKQAIDSELETIKAQHESWRDKLQLTDLLSIMSACKEVESKEAEVETASIDVSLPKVNLGELESKLNSLCDTIKTLLQDNEMQPLLWASSPVTSSSPENTDESHISWDFIVHLCSSAVPQKRSQQASLHPTVCEKEYS